MVNASSVTNSLESASKENAVGAALKPPILEQTSLELAQQLAERLGIKVQDWHRLNSNRNVRAAEQLATALVFLLKDRPEEALIRTQQAVGWLDRTLKAPPCPTHGSKKQNKADK